MITICEECGKEYRVDPNKIKGDMARFKCKSCSHVITVVKPAAAEMEPVAKIEPLPEEPAVPDAEATAEATEVEKLKIEGFSIRSKITLIIVALVVLSLAVSGFIASLQSRTALLEQAENHLNMTAKQKAKEYSLVFQRLVEEAEAIADYAQKAYRKGPAVSDLGLNDHILMPWTGKTYGSPELEIALAGEKRILQQVIRVLQSVVAKDPYVILGYLGTENNMMALDDKGAVESIGKRKGFMNTKRPWYIDAKAAGKTIWTAPYVDANTQDLIVTCATPVYGTGKKLVGVVGYDVLLSTIQKDILAMDIGYNSYAMLADREGKVLVRPGMDRTDIRWDATYQTEYLLKTNNPSFNAIANRMVLGKTGVESYVSEGEGKYISYAPLPVVGASMAIVASMEEVIRPAIAIRNIIAGVFIVVLIISILIGLLIGNNITKPINELTVQANLISRGMRDLDVLKEDRKDEIGVLTQAFNRLVTSLKLAISRF